MSTRTALLLHTLSAVTFALGVGVLSLLYLPEAVAVAERIGLGGVVGGAEQNRGTYLFAGVLSTGGAMTISAAIRSQRF